MQPAADAMAEALKSAAIKAPLVPVITNVTAGPVTDPEAIRAQLVEQVTGRVRWRESVIWMAGEGVSPASPRPARARCSPACSSVRWKALRAWPLMARPIWKPLPPH